MTQNQARMADRSCDRVSDLIRDSFVIRHSRFVIPGSVILLAGASVRAAAASAMRAGLTPWCVDLFADADLARACAVMKLPMDRYPLGFIDALAEGPPGPWQYTGGLENYPELMDAIPRHPLGNSGEVVRAVRGPLATIFGSTAPRECRAGTPSPTVKWLLKPLRGSGGLGVRRWKPGERFDSRTNFLQEYIEGVPCSAAYVGDRLLGATRQLIGSPWLNAPRPFQYAGSIGPLSLSDADEAMLRNWGEHLVKAFHLQGIFGIDFIQTSHGCRPIEINPRYPASTEILERAANCPPRPGPLLPAYRGEREQTRSFGKAILYAERDFAFPADGPWVHSFALDDLRVPFADIPQPGAEIRRGDPILTVFGEGDSLEACETDLRWLVGSVAGQLG